MITKNVEIFSANKLMFSPAGDGWCKVSPCGEFLLRGPKGTKSPWGLDAPRISGGAPQTPVAEGKKNLLSLKAANSRTRGQALLWWCSIEDSGRIGVPLLTAQTVPLS